MESIELEAVKEERAIELKHAESELQKMKEEIGPVKEDVRSLGALQMLNYQQAHNELIMYAMLYKARQDKEHKREGMTWEEYCAAAGYNVRTVNRTLKDIKPIYDQFQDTLACFVNIPFNKIKYLGKSIQDNMAQNEDGNLVIDGTQMSLTPDNKDEIEAAIDTLIETHKKEKQTLKKKLDKEKKDRDKIIAEETRTLSVERDALVEKVERLKEFDPGEKDITWSKEYLEKMAHLVVDFDVAVRKFAMDKRLHDDIGLQAQCQVFIETMVRHSLGLRKDWEAEFNVDDYSDPDVQY